MKSIWDDTIAPSNRERLPGDKSADVVVIGAGICGILTGYFLMQEGKNVIVVEADTIGSGQTHCTTAKITVQHGLFLDTLVQVAGYAQAKQYTDVNRKAINKYEQLISDMRIDCQFERLSSCLYTCTSAGAEALAKERTCALTLGVSCEDNPSCSLPFPVTASLTFPSQAQFNPLPFLYTLAQELTVFEHTKVLSTDSHTVFTDSGNIECEHIVFACHYPFRNFPGMYFLRMHQERSYVTAIELPASQSLAAGTVPSDMYYGIDEDGLSFRRFQNYVLLGGQGHRTGKNSTPHRYDYLEQKAKEFWPGCKSVCHWSAQDCIPLDGIPYIGHYSSKEPNWYVATGFKKWGMTSSMAAALLLKNMICGRSSPYAEVFAPDRPLNSVAFQTLRTNIKESTIALSKEFLTRPGINESILENLSFGESRIITLNGKKTGVYRDMSGSLYAVTTKCPHLGCQLNWNPEDRTWDCPCHGSRFDYTGKLLDGPAQEGCHKTCCPHNL